MPHVGQKRSSEWSLTCVLLLKTANSGYELRRYFFLCGKIGSTSGSKLLPCPEESSSNASRGSYITPDGQKCLWPLSGVRSEPKGLYRFASTLACVSTGQLAAPRAVSACASGSLRRLGQQAHARLAEAAVTAEVGLKGRQKGRILWSLGLTRNPHLDPSLVLRVIHRAFSGISTVSARRGVCHRLAFPALHLPDRISGGCRGRMELPRMASRQAGILKKEMFGSDLVAPGTQLSLSLALPKPQDAPFIRKSFSIFAPSSVPAMWAAPG